MAVITGTTIAGEHVVRIDDREYRNVSESNWRRICRFCRGGSPRAPQARPPMVAFRTWWTRPAKSSEWVMIYQATPESEPEIAQRYGSYDEAHDAMPIDTRYSIMTRKHWEIESQRRRDAILASWDPRIGDSFSPYYGQI